MLLFKNAAFARNTNYSQPYAPVNGGSAFRVAPEAFSARFLSRNSYRRFNPTLRNDARSAMRAASLSAPKECLIARFDLLPVLADKPADFFRCEGEIAVDVESIWVALKYPRSGVKMLLAFPTVWVGVVILSVSSGPACHSRLTTAFFRTFCTRSLPARR